MMGSTSFHHAAALLAGGVISLTSGDNGHGAVPAAPIPAEATAWIDAIAGSREVTIDPLDGMPIIVPDLALYNMPIIPGINTDAMPTLHPDSLGRWKWTD